jgi:hypothetical protein
MLVGFGAPPLASELTPMLSRGLRSVMGNCCISSYSSQTSFVQYSKLDLADADEVEVAVEEEIPVWEGLNDCKMIAEEVAKEECQILNKLLVSAV